MEQQPVKFNSEKWYVRTGDGATYGPASPLELVGWAAEARIVPGCQISQDAASWVPAETIPRLRMEWTVEITPDEKIGPLHLLAIGDLVREGTIPLGAELICPARNVRTTIDHHFFALLLQEARENLGSAAEEENRLLRQIQDEVIPAIRADYEAQWKPIEQAWAVEQAQWKETEQARLGQLAEAKAALDAAVADRQHREDEVAAAQALREKELLAAQASWVSRFKIVEGDCRQLRLHLEREREEFNQVRQGLIAELDETKIRLAQLEAAHKDALRSLDQFRAAEGVERQRSADLERRYLEEAVARQKERDEALKSHDLLRASLENADQERSALRAELETLRDREAQLRIGLNGRQEAEAAQLKLVEQARAEAVNQTRMADELREQLARQTQTNSRLAEELAHPQPAPVDLTPGPTDSVLLDESELLEQECAHLAELLDHLPAVDKGAPVPVTPLSAFDWIEPRPAPSVPVVPLPLSATTPVALRIQGAVRVLHQAEKELAKQRQLYHDLIRGKADREAELTALVEQLKRDLDMSSRLVNQSMGEMEKREGELRQFRRNGGMREAAPDRPPAEPRLEPEVLPPVSMDPPPRKLARDVPLKDPKTVLVGLEKQARADLHNWQKKRAQAEPAAGAMGRLKKWISRDR